MSAAIQAALDTLEKHDAGEPGVVPDAPPVPPPAPAKPPVTFEDILPDTDDLPPTLRGKPLKDLLADRRSAIQQRDEIGRSRNDLESQLRVAQAALNVLGQSAPQAPPAPAKPTPVELLKQRGIDTAMILTDPDRVLAGAIEAGADYAKSELQGEIAALRQQIDGLTGQQAVSDKDRQDARIRDAHAQAYRQLAAGKFKTLTPEQWTADAQYLVSEILASGKDIMNPATYAEAGERFYARVLGVNGGGNGNGNAAPAPAPQVGTGAPAPVAPPSGSSIASLDARERLHFDDITAAFGERIKLSTEKKEKIARDVIAMRKRRG